MQLPVTTAGNSLLAAMARGKFHGVTVIDSVIYMQTREAEERGKYGDVSEWSRWQPETKRALIQKRGVRKKAFHRKLALTATDDAAGNVVQLVAGLCILVRDLRLQLASLSQESALADDPHDFSSGEHERLALLHCEGLSELRDAGLEKVSEL